MKKAVKSHQAIAVKPPKKGGSTKPFFQKKVSPAGGAKSDAFFQPKLKINKPNDKFEKEADHVADQVTSGKPLVNKGVFKQISPLVQRQSENEEENVQAKEQSNKEEIQTKKQNVEEEIQTKSKKEEEVQLKAENEEVQLKSEEEVAQTKKEEKESNVQMKSKEEEEVQMKEEEGEGELQTKKERESVQQKSEKSQNRTLSQGFINKLNAKKGQGTAFSEQVKIKMESAFEADFSDVQIHTDSTAVEMNREIGAQAFTSGSDIFFNQDKFNPDSPSGLHLLAHELTHTIQQGAIKPLSQTDSIEAIHVDTQSLTAQSASASRAPVEDSQSNVNATDELKELDIGDFTFEELEFEVPVVEDIMAGIRPAEQVVNEEVADVKKLKLEGNSEQATNAFIGAGPSQMAASYADLGTTLNNQLKEDKTKEVEEAPVLQAKVSGKVDEGITPANELTPASEVVFDHQAEQSPPDQSLPEHQNIGKAPTSKATDKELDKQDEGSFIGWFKSNFSGFFSKIKTEDEGVNTDAGPRPKLDKSGDADTGQTDNLQRKSNDELGKEKDVAVEALKNNPGQTNIKPQKVDESCEIELPESEAENIITEEKQVLLDYSNAPLPADVRGTADEMLTPNLNQNLNESKNKIDGAAQNRDAEKKLEYDNAEKETEQFNQTAEEEQKNIVIDNRKKVADQQKQGMKEAQDHVKEFDNEAEGEKKKVKTDVDSKIESSEKEADKELEKGEKQAENKKKEEEQKAADKKKELEKEKKSQGFWSRVGSAIKSAVKAITDTITQIFDALRSAVTSIIDAAKNLALAAIESARKWVVDKLNDFRKWAKEKVNKYLKHFPGLAKKINGLIDTVVDGAIAKVNEVTDQLKKGVKALAAGLTKALNKILMVFETALTAAVQIVGAVLTGDFAGALRIAVEAACKIAGIDPKTVFDFLDRAKEKIIDILKDPVKFFGFLVKGVGDGVRSFGENIKTHLINGLIGWLTGALSKVAIKLPEKFDAKGIFGLVLDILGLSYENIKARIIEKYPKTEKVFHYLETGFELIKDFLERGPIAIWEKIKSSLSNIKEMVLGGIRSFIETKVIQAGIEMLLSMTNPVGAIVKMVMMLYNLVMFLIKRFQQIKDFVMSIYNTMAAIASGNVSIVSQKVESALGRSIPVLISLSASLLRMDGIAERVQEIIASIRKPIDKFIDWLIEKAGTWLIDKYNTGKEKVKEVKDKVVAWWNVRKKFKGNDGKNHTLYFRGKKGNAELMVASRPEGLLQKLKGALKNETDPQKKKDIENVIRKKKSLDSLIRKSTRKQVKKQKDTQGLKIEIDSRLNEIANDLINLDIIDVNEKLPLTNVIYKTNEGRAFVVKANPLTKNSGNTKGSSPHAKPLGWQSREQKVGKENMNRWVRLHLLNDNLHGPGSKWNLTPGTKEINSRMEKDVESQAKKLVQQDKVIYYEAQVFYHDGDYKHFPREIDIRYGKMQKKDKRYIKVKGTEKFTAFYQKIPKEALDTDKIINKSSAAKLREASNDVKSENWSHIVKVRRGYSFKYQDRKNIQIKGALFTNINDLYKRMKKYDKHVKKSHKSEEFTSYLPGLKKSLAKKKVRLHD